MSVTFAREGATGFWDAASTIPFVNVSQTNAAFLLELLGLPCEHDQMYGECSPEDFLGRVLVARAVYGHDEGMLPRTLEPGESFDGPGADLFGPAAPGGATFIACGRPEGYADRQLDALYEVADDARVHGANVSWG